MTTAKKLGFAIAALVIIIAYLVTAFAVMVSYNGSVSQMYDLKEMSYAQALFLLFLLAVLRAPLRRG